MEEKEPVSPRARPNSPRGPESPSRSSYVSPTRRIATGLDESGDNDDGSLRRRSSVASRNRVPSLAPRTTLAQRTQGNFTMAGPDETPQLRLAHEPFVQPGYAELNPSYEQPANAKPVWGLAKPLPRVVRPGMVPTREELLEARQNAQLPAENSQKLGLDVDPNDLEKGRIDKTTLSPAKMAAQVEDARLQREANFLDKLLTSDAKSTRLSSRVSRTSSLRRPRDSALGPDVDKLSTVEEGSDQATTTPAAPSHENLHFEDVQHDAPLSPVPEEADGGGDGGSDGGGGDDLAMNIPALDEAAYPEDLHPLIQELVEEEVHNNHTTWSVIRTHHREALAEALAVFVQLTVGFCADLAVTIADAGNPNTTDWAWGFATMMAIYISGGVSGAHLNPAITIMLWFYRGFPKRLMPEYFAAQFIGAFCAALVSYGLYHSSIQHYLASNASTDIVNSFVTNQREAWIGPATAFFTEFVGTVILTVTVLALGDDQNAPPGAGMNSLIIGLVVTCTSISFAYQTGAALNPSRDFGPRLALLALGYGSELFTNPYWFYGPWAGAISGAMIGAFLYDFMIFTGGESPVNYPLERTQRALRKSRAKWSRRLHLKGRENEKIYA